MAGGSKERSLEVTPTWAVAVVCFVLVAISIVIEHLIHLVGEWFKKKHKRALYEALEKIKAELMLLGFISLFLTVVQDYIAKICIPRKVGYSWHPCETKSGVKDDYEDPCESKGKVQFMSAYGIHQLHIFIFVLAVAHILYCVVTLALGRLKMRKWKVWENETKTVEYQYYNDPERFRLAKETSFGRRHLSFWSNSPVLLWTMCFFRQFVTSVAKVDYLTLRHGFIIAHLAPQSEMTFDFQKYISRSLEEDFKVVVGISPIMWLFAVLFLLTNTHGWRSYLWLPFIPLIILLLVGTKLQVVITKMGLRFKDRGDIVKGTPVVKPGDDLFWFNRPRLLLFLIHFVLFINAFQLAFFVWSWYEFGLRTCFHQKREDIIIRLSMGVIIQVLCSYVTLPLYALVTQMGSTMRPTIFSEQVLMGLRNWHHTARKHTKHGQQSSNVTPYSSRPGTPPNGMSPVHLLHNYRNRENDSLQASPWISNFEAERWGGNVEASPSPPHNVHDDAIFDQKEWEDETHELKSNSRDEQTVTNPVRKQHEIQIGVTDLSFRQKR